jgi:hypothetical protein
MTYFTFSRNTATMLVNTCLVHLATDFCDPWYVSAVLSSEEKKAYLEKFCESFVSSFHAI